MKAVREESDGLPAADEMRATLREIDRIAKIVERMNLGDYVGLLQRPARLLWINFLAGLARGLGTVLGATILFSLIVAVVGKIIALHLPVLSQFLDHFLRLSQPQGSGH
ncbi:MAG: hypothetical protein GIW99_03660 [Candidatus Eremiobacteraeota bacterium]|nr:hypothetical protein [Candidatus Eremiobacteraeota bacterium]MBC5826769.1 hypothetical protein [Candidatus Eremiobacteraeota bacterium]